jgi:hypothetical protein
MSDVSVLRDKYRQEKQALWSHIESSNASGRGLKRTLIQAWPIWPMPSWSSFGPMRDLIKVKP